MAFSNPRFNISFDVEYYFPVNQWLVAREDYHRLLKRVYMNGTRNGEPFESYDEYVNFRPRTVYNAIFDICAISPYVRPLFFVFESATQVVKASITVMVSLLIIGCFWL